MAVDLVDLLPAVKGEMNAMGETPTITDDDAESVVTALASAFWTAKAVAGWFPSHRVTVDGDQIVNVAEDGEDLTREEQQIVVLFAVLASWQAKLIGLPTGRRAKAGPNEVEVTRSATLLRGLIASRENRLNDLIEQVRLQGRDSCVGFLDLGALGAAQRDTFVR